MGRRWSYGSRGARRHPSVPNLPWWLLPPMIVGTIMGAVLWVVYTPAAWMVDRLRGDVR